MLYSIPGRCGIEIGLETVRRLAKDWPSIVALKEAGGTVERISALRQVLPDSFDLLSGDDSLTLPFIAAGARGVVSVASNIAPEAVRLVVNLALQGQMAAAEQEHRKWYPLFKDIFIEPNPVPIKYALAKQGRMTAEVRLPLCAMSEASALKLTSTLEKLGLVS